MSPTLSTAAPTSQSLPPPPPPPPPLDLPKYLQDSQLTQECRDLLSILPTEKGWLSTHLHQYQGFWYATRHMQGVLSCQKHFKAHDTDILLVTTPKSGTTWLKAITFALLNRENYPDTTQNHPLLTANPHDLVPFLELKLYVEGQCPDLAPFGSPRLFSTHLPTVSLPESVTASSCKLVYLCRNPRDVFVSFWHFTNKLRLHNMGTNSLDEVYDKFCRGVSIYGPFWDHVLGYWRESLEMPHKVFFLKYEDLKEKPDVNLRRLAEFLGCPFSAEEETEGVVDEILKLCSFDNLSNLEVNRIAKLSSGEENNTFFRRGVVGDWMNYLTDEMIERLDQITEQKLQGSGLKLRCVL
ncbi:cytosolic sulfotransferase 5-like [Malania oleifera]|uniref:cytosolic sulfotransferase 5-like n=1 Tax=Malania oleifera TaxID=397392 RepID=UPI0025AD9F89|nr:cytosolic sulfotransferase 5-like [Malania oleifera]